MRATILAVACLFVGSAGAQCSTYAGNPPGTDLLAGDDTVRVVGLPFAFPFQGTLYHQITIGSNGWIKLGALPNSATEFSDAEAAMLAGAPRIAVCWDDLDASSGGGVYFAADATQASIVWRGVPAFATPNAVLEAECVLLANGEIVLANAAGGTYAGCASTCIVGISRGNGAPPSPHDWTTELAAAPIPVPGGTGYELFAPQAHDLAGLALRFTPSNGVDFLVTAASLPPCGARSLVPLSASTSVPIGAGCPAAVPNGSIYQSFAASPGAGAFDLEHVSLAFARQGDRYTLRPGPPFDAAFASQGTVLAGVGDDTQTAVPLAMGTFSFGGVPVTSVTIGANGYLWLPTGSPAYGASTSSFHGGGPRIAAFWADLNPNGTTAPIVVENTANRFRATWSNVPLYPQTGQHTFQLTLDRATGDISIAFGAMTAATTTSALVGISGGGAADLGSFDLATAGIANAVARQITGGFAPMAHTLSSPPRIGQDFVMASTVPSANLGVGVFAIGAANLALPLDLFFGRGSAPGCTAYTDVLQTLFVAFPPGGNSFSLTLNLPFAASLAGLSLRTQAAAFTPLNTAGLITSDARSFTSGL